MLNAEREQPFETPELSPSNHAGTSGISLGICSVTLMESGRSVGFRDDMMMFKTADESNKKTLGRAKLC